MGSNNMKYKKVFEKKEKKAFMYRIQSLESPLWLNYYQDFDGYYLSIPNEVVEEINKDIAAVISEKYQLKIDPEHKTVSVGVKIYELKEKIGTGKVRLSDLILKFNEYTFGKKVGLSKTLVDAKISERKVDYFANDDYFDSSEAPVISAFDEPEQPTIPDTGDLPF